MTREEFLQELQDVFQREDELSANMLLDDVDEWDSLAVMATMAFLSKKFDIKTSISDYADMKTVEDLIKMAGLD